MLLTIKRSFYTILSMALLSGFRFVEAQNNNNYGLPKTNPGVGDETGNIANTIGQIVTWLLSFVGGLAVLMIIVSGIMYITSGGDEGRVEKAKNWLIYAIVGLIIALLGWVIVNTIVKAL